MEQRALRWLFDHLSEYVALLVRRDPVRYHIDRFLVLSTFNPTTIKFFTFAIGGVDDADNGHFNGGSNPGFEGIVSGGIFPEPATWTMMIAGFGLVGLTARRRAAAVAS